MIRFTTRQRTVLGETVRELANYGAAALVFGQFVGQGTVSWSPVLAGITLWLTFVSLGLVLEGDE